MSSKLDLYTKGTKAWFKDPEDGFVVASMLDKTIDDKKVVMKFLVDATKKGRNFRTVDFKIGSW
ncbi:hypothetical protein BC833DRAFT_587155 [Globomyces pollinis-pini]|nr:hypothetical protein BC833DRAFT_587155 [Globomyces pollinis-pini]